MEIAEQKQGIGGRDCMVANGVYSGRVIISPWPEDGVGITANGETVVLKKEDFRQMIDWLKSWDYI